MYKGSLLAGHRRTNRKKWLRYWETMFRIAKKINSDLIVIEVPDGMEKEEALEQVLCDLKKAKQIRLRNSRG